MNRTLTWALRWLQLAAVGGVAVLAGLVVVGVVEWYLVREERPARSTARFEGRAEARPRLQASGDAVDGRSLFCSTCGARPPQPPPAGVAGAERLDDAVLLATLLPASGEQSSVAEVRFRDSGRTRLLSRGSRVRDARVTRVSTRRVEFERGGRRGFLDLLGGVPGAPAPKRPHPRRARVRSGGIRRLANGRYAVGRRRLRELLQGLGGASIHGSAMPIQRNGRLAGIRLTRVAAGGVLAELGWRRGDEITAVNNQALTSPDVVLGLLGQLRSARHVSVSFVRNGRPRTSDYEIE